MRAEKEQALRGKALDFNWFNHPLAALLCGLRVAFIKIERLEFIRGDFEFADRVHLI